MYHVRPEDRLDDVILTPKNQADKDLLGLETEDENGKLNYCIMRGDTFEREVV